MRIAPVFAALFCAGLLGASCTTLPTPKFTRYAFPKGAVFVGDANRPYTALGWVRTKVNYPSLDPAHEEDDLCRNYYNKAARDLLERARKNGADAVIDLKSVVFLEDGRHETYSTPECADDGQEGQILAQGIAVKWKTGSGQNAPARSEPAGGAERKPPEMAAQAPVQDSIQEPVPALPRENPASAIQKDPEKEELESPAPGASEAAKPAGPPPGFPASPFRPVIRR